MSYTLAYTGAEIDALLGKIDAIFVAEYGSTIYSEVTAAIAAGNKVIVANAGKVYVYAGQDDNGGYVFTQSGPNAAKPNATYVTLSTGNVWSTATIDLATLQQFYASLMEDTASGAIASFPDGADGVPVTELTADIEPIQDLHGQASPYPPNGGKNKLNINVADNTVATVAFTVQKDSAGNVTGVKADGTAQVAAYFNLYIDNSDPVMPLAAGTYKVTGLSTNIRLRIGDSNNSYIDTIAGGEGTFTADGNGNTFQLVVQQGVSVLNEVVTPMVRLSTEADATFAPYSNECPISGYTGAEITVAGKNLLPNVIHQNGTKQVILGQTDAGTRDLFLKAGSYTITYEASSVLGSLYYDMGEGATSLGSVKSASITLSADAYVRFWIYNGASVTASDVSNVRLNVGLTDLGYTDYNTTVYSVSWSDHGTIYKGTAQYKGGGEWEITATHAEVTYNGSEAWDKDSSDGGTRGFYHQQNDLAKGFNYSTLIICDKLKSFVNHVNADYLSAEYGITGFWDAGSLYPTQNLIYAKAAGVTTAAEFKSWLSANPITVVYDLASPATPFTVTGPDPETLLGDNNIWSDTGDISVKYRANTALYIEKKLGGNVQTLSTPRLIGVSPSEGALDVISGNPINIERVPLSEIKAPELDELTEEPELEPYEEPEAEKPEELTEEPEAEEEPAEDAEAEPEDAEEPEA